MFRRVILLCALTASTVAVATACTGHAAGPDATLPPAPAYIESSAEACTVTRPAEPAFVPRPPYPSAPPMRASFWYGTPSLWTELPNDGAWPQLALDKGGDKVWWWSEEFDGRSEQTPALVVTARRIDGTAAPFRATEARSTYHPDFHYAMLVGIGLPTTGCWEITGEYRSHRLVVVEWVP